MYIAVSCTYTGRACGRGLPSSAITVKAANNQVLEGHRSVQNVTISVDGCRIGSCSLDETVHVWSMETGEVPAYLCDRLLNQSKQKTVIE